MNQEFNDPEIFADFIIEAKEHLETIEPNLLELEKTPGNLGLLNEIFRPMHSLKGASGFLGLMNINTLAHRAENILDELRKGAMSVTAEIMDLILSTTDALRQMIDNLETTGVEGDVDIQHLIDAIEALLAGDAPKPVAKPVAKPVLTAPSAASTTPDPVPSAAPADMPAYRLTTFGEGHLADFLEEAGEIIESLNKGLLELEKDASAGGEVVNDLFRFFHNLKGNSGIIGFNEINTLTHEAETLLNRVRKGEMDVSHELVDLLLAVVDVMETLLNRVDAKTGLVTPVNIDSILEKLQKAVTEGVIEAPTRKVEAPAAKTPAKAAAKEAKPAAKADSKAAPAPKPAPAPAAPVEYDPEDVSVFHSTVDQQLDRLREALDLLRENAEQPEVVDSLYRSLTTLENSSGYMGLDEIKIYAQRTASIVDQSRKTGLPFDALQDLMEQECAILRDMLRKALGAMDKVAEAPAPEPEPTPVEEAADEPAEAPEVAPVTTQAAAKNAPAPAKAAPTATPAATPATAAPAAAGQPKPKVSATIRVDHERLDHLMNLIGELIINRNRFSMLARHLEDMEVPEVADVAQNLTETTYAMARISDDLQDTIMKVRMVPISTVFTRFPRLVRDLSRKSGKDVELIMEGEETELDKSVVEVIGDPLVHLIRNSVDHGIESEEVRAAAGKKPGGSIWLRAYHKGNSVAIEVEDDGKGIDPDKMREVAVRKGVITQEEARNLDDREAMELIFAPGFSSAEKITDISGRGVGMDVVRTNIKNLKGSVNVISEVGKGTRFILSLPLTLAIIDALMVNVSGEVFAIPLDAVSETTKIEARKLTDVNNRKAVTLRGEVLGIIDLSELLELPSAEEEPEILSVVVIHDNERRLGLVVDRLLERQEIVIKPLGSYLGDQKGISGATIMGDGSVVLILDPHEVYLMATSKAI